MPRMFAVSSICLAVLSGCATSLDRAAIGVAAPVTDATGYNNIFRDGSVYFAGQPTPDALREAAERGVKMVVNIRSVEEMTSRVTFDESALVTELGMEYVIIPVTPATLGPDHADRLKSALASTAGPVLLHCGSSNRAGGLWALYLHRHRGFDVAEALERGRSAGMRSDSVVGAVKRAAMAE